ncbi:restriction endonuclease subunit S [Flavobacterium sp. WC2409]|uniref:Restriction endonuclease subunit S n=1 Tax=Flavobacterium sp. WC2409 TaxID=3234139 RepID=A0AB39W473_9FLAO
MNTTILHTTKYKNSPLGLIPEDWEVKKIGKITKTTAGGTPSTNRSEYWNGKIKWMSSGDLNLKRVFDVGGRITEIGLKNSSTKLIPVKCILIGLAGQGKTRGTVAMNMVELCTNQSVAAIFPSNEFYEEYLYHNLDFRYFELRQLSTGDGGRGGLNLNIINSIPVPIPPLPEQKAIADCLSTWDKAIEKQTALIAQKELSKKALMQQLLSGKKRLKGFSGEWKILGLNEVSDVRDGTHESPKYIENGVKFITSKNIKDGELDFSSISYISKEDADNFDRRSKVHKGDILISMIGTIGNSVLINYEPDFCIKNVGLIKSKKIEATFLIQYFHSTLFQNYLLGQQDGGIQKFISLSGLRNLKVPYPSKEEQTAIANVLQCVDDEIQLLKKKLNQLKEQKKGLMQVLLTGKKRLKY